MTAPANLTIMPAPVVSIPQEVAQTRLGPSASRSTLTLYAMEDHLAALMDTAEVVPFDQEEELVNTIWNAMVSAIDKRDSMGRFLAHLETQIEFADAEIVRLQERKQTFARILERTEAYVARIIQSLGQDTQGKWRKLEGHTVTFSLRRQPPSVLVHNEADVPTSYRKTTVKMAAPLWEELVDCLSVDLAGRVLDATKRSDEVSKSAIKEAIDGGIDVPGARLVKDVVKLKRG